MMAICDVDGLSDKFGIKKNIYLIHCTISIKNYKQENFWTVGTCRIIVIQIKQYHLQDKNFAIISFEQTILLQRQ
jgi:hypothetical protein